VRALGAVQEVHGKLLVLGRGLGDLLRCRVDVGVADASFSAEGWDTKGMPQREEESSRCGEEDVA
jgi:hypothetical protein